MKTLVINSGSFSFKYKIFGEDLLLLSQDALEGEDIDIKEGVRKALREVNDLGAIGHRVVHGGRKFLEPVKIDGEVLKELEKYNSLAPLHNPYNLAGIKAALELSPRTPNFSVFDTSFFKDMPEEAKIYALPLEYYQKGIQRYGFHGISHNYVAQEAARRLNKDLANCNLITIHLGGGSSMAAIKQGKAIDTSMGLTPLEGLVMGTRCGDIDPGIIFALSRDYGLSLEKIERLLNEESGVKGLCGKADFREVLKAKARGEKESLIAFDIFIYRIKKYIGAYLAILGEIDAVIFTGAIGSGQEITRKEIIRDLTLIKGVPIMAIETDEELFIAQEIKKLI